MPWEAQNEQNFKPLLLSLIIIGTLVTLIACPKPDDEIKEKPKGSVNQKAHEVVLIRGGTFTMGSAPEYDSFGNETRFQVTLDSFYIGKYEVTQGEYKEIIGKNPVAEAVKTNKDEFEKFLGDKRPVNLVSWFDALEYLNALSKKKKPIPVYTITKTDPAIQSTWSATANWNANGYRLPTEAEWEYAARGGGSGSGKLATGKYYVPESELGTIAWGGKNAGGRTHDVGLKKPNSNKLYDVLGNLAEFCWGTVSKYPKTPQKNYRADPDGSSVSGRGGNYNGAWRLGERAGHDAPAGSYVWGFRITRNAD